ARGAAAFCLAALFATLVIAVDGRPHVAAAPRVPITHALERVGSLMFAFGLWLYATGDGNYELPLRCLLLLLLLYLLARLWHWSRARPARNWRTAYRMLALGTGLAAASVAGPLLLDGPAALLALPWLAVPAAVAAAVLTSSAAPAADDDDDEPQEPQRLALEPEPLLKLWSGPLTGYAMAFPVLHLAGYALRLLDPASARSRAVLALVLLLGLGALALWQHKELTRRADDTQRMYERVS